MVGECNWNEQWVCFACSSKLRLGELICRDTLRCPKCDSSDLHPATGAVGPLAAFHGDRGTIQ